MTAWVYVLEHGENQDLALDKVSYDRVVGDGDLSGLGKDAIRALLEKHHLRLRERIDAWTGELVSFANAIVPGDLASSIETTGRHSARRIMSDYEYRPDYLTSRCAYSTLWSGSAQTCRAPPLIGNCLIPRVELNVFRAERNGAAQTGSSHQGRLYLACDPSLSAQTPITANLMSFRT